MVDPASKHTVAAALGAFERIVADRRAAPSRLVEPPRPVAERPAGPEADEVELRPADGDGAEDPRGEGADRVDVGTSAANADRADGRDRAEDLGDHADELVEDSEPVSDVELVEGIQPVRGDDFVEKGERRLQGDETELDGAGVIDESIELDGPGDVAAPARMLARHPPAPAQPDHHTPPLATDPFDALRLRERHDVHRRPRRLRLAAFVVAIAAISLYAWVERDERNSRPVVPAQTPATRSTSIPKDPTVTEATAAATTTPSPSDPALTVASSAASPPGALPTNPAATPTSVPAGVSTTPGGPSATTAGAAVTSAPLPSSL